MTNILEHDELILQLWWMQCSGLVLMMLYGFHLLESGWALEKHTAGIATKNIMMFLASSCAYTLVGHSLMFGDSWRGLCGMPGTISAKHWSVARFFFQTGFASVAATIISGAIVGRTTLFSNVVAAALIAGVIYPIHGHWIWHENGWLYGRVHDFAGSGVVHVVGGTAALVASCFAKTPATGKPVVEPHGSSDQKMHLAAGGVLILVIGWMGFNGGSITSYKELVSRVGDHFPFVPATYIQNTILAAASGAAVAYLWSRFWLHEVLANKQITFHAFNVLSGTMAGMVAVSACGDILTTPYLALAVGATGGLACSVVSVAMAHSRLIDTVDAVAVHLGGGLAGLGCAGIVEKCFGWQLLDMSLAFAFTAANMIVICWILMYFPNSNELLRAEGDWRGLKVAPDDLRLRKRLWRWTLILSIPITGIFATILGVWDPIKLLTILALLAPVIAVSIKLSEKYSKLFSFLGVPTVFKGNIEDRDRCPNWSDSSDIVYSTRDRLRGKNLTPYAVHLGFESASRNHLSSINLHRNEFYSLTIPVGSMVVRIRRVAAKATCEEQTRTVKKRE